MKYKGRRYFHVRICYLDCKSNIRLNRLKLLNSFLTDSRTKPKSVPKRGDFSFSKFLFFFIIFTKLTISFL